MAGAGAGSPTAHLLGSTVGDGIDAVVISHGHPDHMIDLHGLFRAGWFRAAVAPDRPPGGAAAAVAGARRLILTHFWPGNDREQSRADAAEMSSGEILLAEEGLVVDLG